MQSHLSAIISQILEYFKSPTWHNEWLYAILEINFKRKSLIIRRRDDKCQKPVIQISPKGEVNSGGYIPRREASQYISTALHRP